MLIQAACMDMFDPTGGAYARGRYTKSDAFTVKATRNSHGVGLLISPVSTKSKVRVSAVYFFRRERLGHASENGPSVKYELMTDGTISLALSASQLAEFDGIVVSGKYLQPELVVDGARSVQAGLTYDFSEMESPK